MLRAGPASGFGNAIYIQDADGDVQVYGHMRYYYVRAGQIVHAGDLIAKVGSQGESTGPHLHFQLDRGSMTGKPFDPIPWFAPAASRSPAPDRRDHEAGSDRRRAARPLLNFMIVRLGPHSFTSGA